MVEANYPLQQFQPQLQQQQQQQEGRNRDRPPTYVSHVEQDERGGGGVRALEEREEREGRRVMGARREREGIEEMGEDEVHELAY